MDYQSFLDTKQFDIVQAGFDASMMTMPNLIKPFQKDIALWSCKRGKAAIFADTGLGKTLMQLTWAHLVNVKTSKPVIVLAPLCVAQQTVREGHKFGIDSEYHRSQPESVNGIIVTNYEMLKNFKPDSFSGIVLDESSILKGMDGKTRKFITGFAKNIPYRLSCTATPSPNDFMELGTQSEFLGIMSQVEMLATFFIHDGGMTGWDCGIAWCNLNDESEMISKLSGSQEITGSMNPDIKEKKIIGFTNQDINMITTKPKIAGFGLNWQHCNKMVFVGLSDSFESFYQAVRRCWRFGQTKPVDVHIVISDREGAVLDNIIRKQKQHDQMAIEMAGIMRDLTIAEIKGATVEKASYQPQDKMTIPGFL